MKTETELLAKTDEKGVNFLEKIVIDDLKNGSVKKIVTRFPPEPNGYLHLGHVKSICINFGMAKKYKGVCHLRMDDTNPAKEDDEYISSIVEDVKWLGFSFGKKIYYASDYYDKLYKIAVNLIKKGLAYVDELTPDELREYRGTLTEPGRPSPYRDRLIEENLKLFERMKKGEFPEGSLSLRAKIDMASPNINMRDPVLYRIKYAEHPRTGKKWCIYPMYDFTHPISDAIEGITHSFCTLEFEDHRPAYDWACEIDGIDNFPKQREFARLNIDYFVMSKRRLLELVQKGYVDSWDDPRMPTISAARRRGYTPDALKDFVARSGVAKVEGRIEYSLLEFCVREDLNKKAQRLMGVIDPLELVIENYPDKKTEEIILENNPEDESKGKRKVKFSKNLYVEKTDFAEVPPKGWHRLAIGEEVRLKSAYYITVTRVEKNNAGEVVRLYATYDPKSFGGETADGRKVRGTIHWLSKEEATPVEFYLYDKLFNEPIPGEKTGNFLDDINKESLVIKKGYAEKFSLTFKPGDPIQFMRIGYFTPDSKHLKMGKLVFNKTVGLKDGYKANKG